MILCKLCGEEKEDRLFKFENGRVRKRICYRCLGQRERAQLKLEMIEALGHVCSCCGEDNPYFLSLDHIKNDGAVHRKTMNEAQVYRAARREGWLSGRYQLLCMNCNFAKGHFQECPHKLGIGAAEALEQLRRRARTVMRTRHDLQAAYTGNQWGKKK